jgi:hypothetical protein
MANKLSTQIIIEAQFKKWKSCKCIVFMMFIILFKHNRILWFDQYFENDEMDYQTYHSSIHKVVLEHLLSIAICWKEI